MKFSMIVVITSCAPNLALSAPGTAPTAAPPAAAATMKTGNVRNEFIPVGSSNPTSAATNPPAAS